MAAGVLVPEDVGPADTARVLDFVNGVADAAALAETVGFSEGPAIAGRIAEAILERRGAVGPFATLESLLAVTGVNLPRFTEIVVALSGARSNAPVRTLRLTPASERPWLGQSVLIAGQLFDAQGAGVPGAAITCVASSGLLFAPNDRGEVQRGAALSLTSESGGIVSLEWQPSFRPPLDLEAKSALEAELTNLGSDASSAAAAGPALAAFADRYRGEGSRALREAVDRLFDAFPVDSEGAGLGWSVETVTILAIVGVGDGQPVLAGTVTLSFRNWLGRWLAALGDAIQSDRRLDDALAQFQIDDDEGDAARGLIALTQAFAGLELGVVGGRERDRLTGEAAIRFAERLSGQLQTTSLEDVVRATGASSSAIAAGGFAFFDAVQNVQSVSDTIGPGRVDTGKLGALDGRLVQLEAKTVDRQALDGLRADILTLTDGKLADVGGKIASLETDRVTRTQLAGLAALVGAKADQTALAGLNLALIGRLNSLRTELDTATDTKVAVVAGKIASLEADRVTRSDLTRLETQLQHFATDFGGTRAELLAQINAKADRNAFVTLDQSVKLLQTENKRFATQIENVDFSELRGNRPLGPGR